MNRELREPDYTIQPKNDDFFSEIEKQQERDRKTHERLVFSAVENLLSNTNKASLHFTGDPTPEYLGMLALYALRWVLNTTDNPGLKKSIEIIYKNFDPFNMSDSLMEALARKTEEMN